jgi:hypothetical protein
MKDINSILYLGKVIKLVDVDENCWECGISKFVKEYQIVCELLKNPSIVDSMTVKHPDNGDFYKLAIAHGSGVYLAPARIERLVGEDGKLKFFISEQYEFVQRREYYRLVDPNLEIECKIHGETYETSALDLAGGGIGLLIKRDRSIKKDTLLELRIILPDGKSLQVGARSTNVVLAEEPGKYIVGAYFSKISSADESKIMKHIFSEQIRKSKEVHEAS